VKVPEELASQWWEEAVEVRSEYWPTYVANKAAQWGWDQREPELQERADQELEACCEWLRSKDILEPAIDALRAARRPKPPTLAEQGMEALNKGCFPSNDEIAAIRAALNHLAELEAQQ
jgi:hypothetical protein